MLSRLNQFLKEYGLNRTYWIAFSGGLDSRVLLDLLVKARQANPFSLRVLHVHHGLSPQADRWAAHCAPICEQAQVDLQILRIDARPPAGESLEDYARKGRYAALEQKLGPDDILLTAHHQDDQAETLLLQLLRGAGLKGLSAMPAIKPLGQGWQARPLLGYTRAELQSYAEEQGLSWVEDELNQDLHYPRNYIRHEVLPLLKKYWPAATSTLGRSAENCAEAQALLDEFASQDLARMGGSKPHTLSVKLLLELSPARQRLVLRYWFESLGVPVPPAVKLRQLQQDVLHARWDGMPYVTWQQISLRRYQDDLFLLPVLAEHDTERVYTWDLTQPLAISGVGELKAVPSLGEGLGGPIQRLEVRFRQGGEVYQSSGGQHRELKKFFQEQGIPPWERDRLPLLWFDDELAAIPGYFIADRFKAKPGERGMIFLIMKREG